DELTCFIQYLYKTGVYLSIRNALKTKVTLLLDHKFQMPSYTLDSCEGQVIDRIKNDPDAWINYAIFLLKIRDTERAEECSEECMKDKDQDLSINDQEPLAWSMIHCPRDSIYSMTATFLLKLHLYDLTDIALAEEMSLTGRSTHFLYYLAVEHYLLHRYEDALFHLKEAQYQYGMDYSISCLMGHCYFQNGDLEEAIKYYEFANMVFNRPDNIYLMQLRMGLCYESKMDYEKAKKVLLNACQSSPTSFSWLHAGISFYKLNQLKEAELALIEANKIDNCNADVWGYLCLLNLSIKRYDEFTLCYRQAIKYNLQNEQLLSEIREFMKRLNYKIELLQVT
ncbi:hypothetical protein M0802_015518, partial [Mischocyttarus mexicanus]